MNDLEKAIRAIDLRFQSGNKIPIDKAVVPKKEWESLLKELDNKTRKTVCMLPDGDGGFFIVEEKMLKEVQHLGLKGLKMYLE